VAIRLLERIQSWAPVPVYPIVGNGGIAAVEELRLDAALIFVSNIRHASILLVCGEIRAADQPALRRLHDQMPHPRATFWWRSAPLSDVVDPITEAGDDPAGVLIRLDSLLRTGTRNSEADWLPDEPPNAWEDKGDHGQGGKGMMGGVPYGRPMAMTDDDLRDGLMLDAMTICIGPFAPMLPAGFSLQLTLQGDVIQTAKVLSPAYVEQASRKKASLWQAASLLDLLGLNVHAMRCRSGGDEPDFSREKLYAAARRSGAFAAIPPGLGSIGDSDVRSRLRDALLGVQPGLFDQPPDLVQLIVGCEWQEAMLVINSFAAEQLAQIAPVTLEPGEVKDKQEQNPGHAHHHGHG
jgi:hypothetical protein